MHPESSALKNKKQRILMYVVFLLFHKMRNCQCEDSMHYIGCSENISSLNAGLSHTGRVDRDESHEPLRP